MRFVQKLKPALAVLLLTLLCAGSAQARDLVSKVVELDRLPPPRPDFPVPNEPNQLFYIQRSTNPNTVVYTANMDKPGEIDAANPIHAYWRRYNNKGEVMDLRFFEKLVAFGVHARPLKGQPNKFDAYIAGYSERRFVVDTDQNGNPEAVMDIDGHPARMVFAFVELDDSGILPSLVYCDIYGIDKVSGRVLHEHLTPG